MAVHDTAQNKRTDYTRATLLCLTETVDFKKHRLIISDNGSCDDTQKLYPHIGTWIKLNGKPENFKLILNAENLGTAAAINKGLQLRELNEFCVKIDNDVEVLSTGWVDEMEEAMLRGYTYGLIGLKRRDLEQKPNHQNEIFRSNLVMLPHQKGDRWIVVEECADIMGTCVMYNHRLLDKIGYQKQPSNYGWEDCDFAVRSRMAGFKNAFLPHIEIEHLDSVPSKEYQEWKEKTAKEAGAEFQNYIAGYNDKTIPIYYNPYE